MLETNCGNCKHLVQPISSKGELLSFRKNLMYSCDYPIYIDNLPDCITKVDTFKPYRRWHMEIIDGKDCPTWEPA
jgi:hypothetical protein